tara:strand:- start:72 stop:713 length:642 start_codon:yes stop_codon:yes gene_type:complete
MADNLPKEFLAERDARIFSLKKSGLSNSDIAKRFEMSAGAVAAATRRQLNKLNSEAFLAYPEVLRLELERLDEMQKSLWPLTQFRREELEDGSTVTVEPDQRAVQTVLGIMDRRARLLGMNVERVDIALNTLGEATVVDARSTLAGAEAAALPKGSDPKEESMQLLELMGQSGVLDSSVLGEILGNVRDTIEVSSENIVEEEDGTVVVSVEEA